MPVGTKFYAGELMEYWKKTEAYGPVYRADLLKLWRQCAARHQPDAMHADAYRDALGEIDRAEKS